VKNGGFSTAVEHPPCSSTNFPLASGKHTKNYGKSPLLMGKSPLLMGKSPFLMGKSTINDHFQ
jgi:hypothetical protein